MTIWIKYFILILTLRWKEVFCYPTWKCWCFFLKGEWKFCQIVNEKGCYLLIRTIHTRNKVLWKKKVLKRMFNMSADPVDTCRWSVWDLWHLLKKPSVWTRSCVCTSSCAACGLFKEVVMEKALICSQTVLLNEDLHSNVPSILSTCPCSFWTDLP